jgi:hypothetical protein
MMIVVATLVAGSDVTVLQGHPATPVGLAQWIALTVSIRLLGEQGIRRASGRRHDQDL